jgi:hypothetical protein
MRVVGTIKSTDHLCDYCLLLRRKNIDEKIKRFGYNQQTQ